jgi:hypothetical protein
MNQSTNLNKIWVPTINGTIPQNVLDLLKTNPALFSAFQRLSPLIDFAKFCELNKYSLDDDFAGYVLEGNEYELE